MSKQDINQNDAVAQVEPLSLDDLIEQQQVFPIYDIDEISSLWPADDDPNLLLDFVLNDRIERRRLITERERIG